MSARSSSATTAATTAPRRAGTSSRTSRRIALPFVLAMLASSLVGVMADPVVAPVLAAGTPDITVTRTADAETLIGGVTNVTLRACNRSTQPDGFNLSFRDVLPVGLTLTSATPAPTRTIANAPSVGETTLIWENVSDLLSGTCNSVSYGIDTNSDNNLSTNRVGSTISSTAGAYVNSDAFFVPDFDATGLPTTDITGNDTDTGTVTTIVAFIAEKEADNAGEGELLRGVHGSMPRTYTLRVRNNSESPTNDFTIVDVLPASLEFLGCASYVASGYSAGTDNTIDAPTNETPGLQTDEYVGSGRLALGAAGASCIQPTTIETLGDGSTRVTWTAAMLGATGDLAASGTLEISYLAGIPLRANTDTWPNGKPTNGSLGQGRNLDNNGGAPTSETATEPAVTNTLSATGTYIGPSTTTTNPTITDTATATVTAEDLVIRKSMSGQVIQGTVVTSTLVIETGEYRSLTDLVVTDTLPDGLCPLAVTPLSGDADCGSGADPTIDTGSGPMAAPYTSATENADGTWTLVWDDALLDLTSLDHAAQLTISFQSRVRRFYQEGFAPEAGRPILNFDSLTNNVLVEALDLRRTEIDPVLGDPELDGELDFDVSSATIDGIGLTIDKRVSTRAGALVSGSGLSNAGTGNVGDVGDVCRAGTGFTWVDGDTTAVTGYRPGDYVCFDLRATFPADVDADGVEITDLLPAKFDYVPGSARRVTATDNLPGTTVSADLSGANDIITFTVENTGQVPSDPGGRTFHWTIAARVGDPTLSAAYDINANLMKMTTRNSAGDVFMYRDQATVEWTEPQVALDKTNNASGALDGGDDVVYTVRVWNTGNVAAVNGVVWDRLPTGLTCADVTVSTPTATCTSGVLVWDAADIPTIAANTALGTAPVTLTYTVDLPDSVDPGRTYTNTAGVRRYEAETNASDSPAVFFPATNIDPTVVATNAASARDTSTITIRSAANSKLQQSGVSDGASNPANVAPATTAEIVTIGETITYTITATIPEGTSVIDARVTDTFDPDGDIVLHTTPTWSFAGITDNPLWTLTAPAIGANGTVQLDMAGTYTNAANSGDDILTLTIVARVSNAAGTTAGDTIPNQTAFSFLPAPVIGTTRTTLTTANITATVREPNPTITKNENDADDIVSPNDVLVYTLTINNTGTNPVRAHDLVVVDTVPVGITVRNGVTPVADGGTVAPDGGIWNATLRTITWNRTTTPAKLASVAAAASTTLSYDVIVDSPAASGATLTNNVTLSASSLAGPESAERSNYASAASDVVSAPPVTSSKSVNPTSATIGDTVTYTIDTTVPAGVTSYDTTVLDTLGDGLDFVGFGSIAYIGTSTGCSALTNAQGIAGRTPVADGSTILGFWLDEIAAPGTNSCVVRMTYTARVDNTYEPEGTAVVAGNSISNSARTHWNRTNVMSSVPATPPSAASFASATSPATAVVTVREPSLRIDKDVSQVGCDATPGNTGDNDTCNTDIGASYTYTLRITNESTTWPAHDIVVVDTPDADLVNIVVPPSSGAITVIDGSAPDLSWLISTIPADSSVTITYAADLAASATLDDGEQVINTADVTEYFAQPLATRAGDLAAEWRTYGQGGAGGDVAADTVTMTVGFPHVTVVKTAISDATDARAGVPFAWRIVATNQATEPTAAAYGVDIDDVLPAGWVYQSGSTSITTPHGTITTDPVCTPSCATPGATLLWSNVVNGAGQPLNPAATITVNFNAIPQSSLLTMGTTGAFDHINVAGIAGVEDVTGATSNLDGVYAGPDDDASARIRRTDLSVTKAVSAGPYAFGNDVNWTITVNNAGPDTATGVTVTDILPVSLIYVTTVSATQGSYTSGTGVWNVGSVANGATHTLVIRTRLNVIGPITNRAEVQTNNQWDVDSTPAGQAAVADEDDDDTVTINAGFTSLGDYIWYDIDGDSTADVAEPGIAGVRVILESEGADGTFGTSDDFFGPDGVVDGGDDITVTDAVTNGTGFYGFSNLPTGDYRVRVDTTTLPAGVAPTFNDDAPNTADPDLDHRTGLITLVSSTGYLAADFGYTGTGSLGDTVWLDMDASGGAVRQAGEPGLGGIDITLVWGGFDGDLATTADNITYPIDTTDAAGQYLFDLLPAGPFRVTVDGVDVPTGTIASYDLDTVASANTTTTSLAAGQDRTDVDFSYAGTGSIGDRIWFDRDGDGALGAGDPGLGGIDVTVTWLGPDLAVGGVDDVAFTTTTDATGTYLVDHLPAGSYVVTVDSADLPGGVVSTADLDGTGTAHTAIAALGDGQNRVDLDFVYAADTSVGDLVWFDLDGDGADAPESGDPRLAGVPVDVTSAGPDATFGTTDDIVVSTTTNASGAYLVTGLPWGQVRVDLNTAGLGGFAATFDGDGIASLHSVTLTLAADDPGTTDVDEANRRDADFAFTGTGSIGDLVWVDADANGTRGAGESALAGVDVTITWSGLDGVAGTADDVVFTTTTDADGIYLVDLLPAGAYTVVVDTTDVPVGMVNVADPDPTRDSRTSTTLLPGQDRTDIDFGYQSQADLALQKSHSARFEVGQNAVYTIAVTNAGPASATTPRVTDVLPAGLTYVSGTGTGVVCAAVGQTVTCDLPTMAINTSSSITLTVAVGRAAAPGVVNTASVSSPTVDPAPENNADADPTEVPLADLSVTKRLDGALVANQTTPYVIDATNLGPSPSGGALVITDELPVGLVYISATSPGATCSATGQLVSCRTAATVSAGTTITITVWVLVTATVGAQVMNSAQVVIDTNFGSSMPTDPVATNNTAFTQAAVVSADLPATGIDLVREWLQWGLLAVAAGALVVLVSRRRRHTLG